MLKNAKAQLGILVEELNLDLYYEKYSERIQKAVNRLKIGKKHVIWAIVPGAAMCLVLAALSVLGGIVFNSLVFSLFTIITYLLSMIVIGALIFVRIFIGRAEKAAIEIVTAGYELVDEIMQDMVRERENTPDAGEAVKLIFYGFIIPKSGEIARKTMNFAGVKLYFILDRAINELTNDAAQYLEKNIKNTLLEGYINFKIDKYHDIIKDAIGSEINEVGDIITEIAAHHTKDFVYNIFEEKINKEGYEQINKYINNMRDNIKQKDSMLLKSVTAIKNIIKKFISKPRFALDIIIAAAVLFETLKITMLFFIMFEK